MSPTLGRMIIAVVLTIGVCPTAGAVGSPRRRELAAVRTAQGNQVVRKIARLNTCKSLPILP